MTSTVKLSELESWQAYSDHSDCPVCAGHGAEPEECRLCATCRKPLNDDEYDKCEDCWMLEGMS